MRRVVLIFTFLVVPFTIDRIAKLYVIQKDADICVNTGLMTGAYSGNNVFYAILGAVVVLLLAFYLFRYYVENIESWMLLIIISAIVSNTWDRLYYGGVIDFIKIGGLPVSNLADWFIPLAIMGILVSILVDYFKHKKH
jgi:lipoprotein signal peptidase